MVSSRHDDNTGYIDRLPREQRAIGPVLLDFIHSSRLYTSE